MTSGSDSYSIAVTRTPVVRVSLRGEIDLAAEPVVVDAFTRALSGDTTLDLVDVDVSGVDFMDSCGLRALLRCRELATTQGVEFRLTVIDGPVSRLLEVAGVSDWFRGAR